MKKLVLFVMAVMAFAGMSVAQDIYSSGYYFVNDQQAAAVYRNGEKLYESVPGGTGYGFDNPDVDYYEGDVYWVRNRVNGDGTFFYADIFKNDGLFLDSPTDQGRHIYDLYRWPERPEIGLFAVGCMDVDAVRTAVVWKDDDPDIFHQLGDGTWPSVAYGATANDDGLFACGVQYGYEETSYHGVIWKGSSVFHAFQDGTKIFDIAYYDGCLYAVGTLNEDGSVKLKVWRTQVNDEDTEEIYELSDSYEDYPDRTKIFVDETGDIYVVGVTPYFDRLYKNGNEIYKTPAFFTSVFVNSNGVYYAGSADDNGGYEGVQKGRIWKDGELLYSPSDCGRVTNLYIAELECANNEARPLPYFEGFETGNTDWSCWLKVDADESNGVFASYWNRVGENMPYIYAANGDYCAMHYYGPEDVEQEGWLASPLIGIPADGGNVKMTFNTAEYYTDDYEYEGVWAASESIPDGVELWVASSDFVSNEWKTVELDLSAYKGMDIRVYFKYVGTYAHFWYVDDVSIEQEAAPATYTITTDVNPAGAGTVDGGGTYPAGTEVTLTATANTGYTFSHWQDGITANPRTITVNGNETYTAYFTTGGGVTMYTVTVVSENPLLGTVTGGGTYPSGAVIQISATPSPQARFVSWNDGNTDNPRNITVTGDVTYTAKFEALQNYTITVVSANPAMGTAEGGGTFLEGTVINISATPLAGYYFIGWNDGNADNPRSITVTANETYVAQFGTNPVQTYTLTVMCNSSEGSTIGSGTYTAGSTTTIAAIPNSGYLFDKWQDNVTENPRQVIVNSDMTFVAFFKGTGVNENEGHLMVLYPNPANDYVRLEGIEANSEVRIYNAMGALVKVLNANPNEEIGISELSDGLYVLRCGNVTLRFVKK